MADQSRSNSAMDVSEVSDQQENNNGQAGNTPLPDSTNPSNSADEPQTGINSEPFPDLPMDMDEGSDLMGQIDTSSFMTTHPPAPATSQGTSHAPMTAPPQLHVDTTVDAADDEPTPPADQMDVRFDTPPSGGPIFPPSLQCDDSVKDAIENSTQTLSRPIGFYNPAYQCYLNSVLAALASSRKLVGHLESWYSCKENEPDSMKPHILLRRIHNSVGTWYREASQKTVNRVKRQFVDNCCISSDGRSGIAQPQGGVVTAASTWSSWMDISDNEALTRQHDASEFLVWLLESTDDQLAYNVEPQLSGETRGSTTAQKRFSALYQFSLTERITCPQCSPPVSWRRPRDETERLLELALEDNSEQRSTLESLIQNHFDKNSVPDWTSDECGHEPPTAEKKLRLQNAPSVLFIHMKRQGFTRAPITGGPATEYKMLDRVLIPEHLDLSAYLEPHAFGKGSVAKYRLRAIISHAHLLVPEGSEVPSTGGHYVSLVRAGEKDDTWYLIDDERVAKRDLNAINDSRNRLRVGKDRDYEATPDLMLYELDELDAKPGREPFLEQRSKSELPSHLLPSGSPEQQEKPPADSRNDEPRKKDFVPWRDMDFEDSTLEGPVDKTAPCAQLYLGLSINGKKFEYKTQQLPGFKMHSERLVTMDVALKAKDPDNKKDDLYLDALKALQNIERKGYWVRPTTLQRSIRTPSFRQRMKPGGARRTKQAQLPLRGKSE